MITSSPAGVSLETALGAAAALDRNTIASGDKFSVLDISAPAGSKSSEIPHSELLAAILAYLATQNLTVATLNGATITAGSGTLTLANGKVLTASNTLTLTGTDGITAAFGGGLSIAALKVLTASNTLTFTGTDGITVGFGGGLSIAAGKVATVSNTLTFTGTDTSSVAFGAGGTILYAGSTVAWTGAHSNSYAGTASTPAMKWTGVPFAGTGTTSVPLVFISDPNATPSTSYNVAGCLWGANTTGTYDVENITRDGSTTLRKLNYLGTMTLGGAAPTLNFGTSGNIYVGLAGADIALNNVNGGAVTMYGTTLSLRTSGKDPAVTIANNGDVAVLSKLTVTGVATFTTVPRFNGGNTTGGGTALLSTNSPAVTNTAPYTWVTITTADGSTAYVPAWK